VCDAGGDGRFDALLIAVRLMRLMRRQFTSAALAIACRTMRFHFTSNAAHKTSRALGGKDAAKVIRSISAPE
jgi:hypothetical protein